MSLDLASHESKASSVSISTVGFVSAGAIAQQQRKMVLTVEGSQSRSQTKATMRVFVALFLALSSTAEAADYSTKCTAEE